MNDYPISDKLKKVLYMKTLSHVFKINHDNLVSRQFDFLLADGASRER